MEKTYHPAALEKRWYTYWEAQGHFRPSGAGAPFCIMIPPPNVTGTLHMGHAFQDTLMDALSRYQRMRGRDTLWQPGTDHAGIATQMVVERQLNAAGQTRHDLGRAAFIDRVWQWKEDSGTTITQQLRRMGASVDWDRERFTMDAGLSAAVREVFVTLCEQGLIYRGKRLVNWDPVLHTALSDLEVEAEEEPGHLWHMRYPLADGDGHLSVATTRPETMLGDTAVAVHPDDARFSHWVGREVVLPLAGRTIPIIADDYVDPEFGSGCVKITPAHDFNDYAVGQRHGLPLINILTLDAYINEQAPAAYQGLDRFAARQRIVADLKDGGLLERIDDHRLMVPRGDRSHEIVEPMLTDQWYVKVGPLAAPAIRAVEDGRIRFIPGNWRKTYFEWMRNLDDWCISRQLWWGHRIPAWYDRNGHHYVGRDFEEARAKALADDSDIREQDQDEDVLDTWFSSALWPFSTLGWPERTAALQTFYPTSVLVTGFDIIFFWVARMIMLGLKFMDDVPFREVYITGLIRDADGQKMSKSKGNVLDPVDLIDGIEREALVAKRTAGLMQPDKAEHIAAMTRRHYPEGIHAYGTDALRFTFAAMASTGRDIKFDLNRIEGYRNFCNKLWNATRYVLMNTEGTDTGLNGEPLERSLADRWILARLNITIDEIGRQFDNYRFDLAANALHDFTWHDYCDWYLELSKPVLQAPDSTAAQRRGTRRTLVTVLEALLRLLHPLMPFITEELWQSMAPMAGKQGDTIQLQSWPKGDTAPDESQTIDELEWVKAFIMGVRRIRAEMDLAPGRPLPVLLQNWDSHDRARLESNAAFITTLAKLESVTWLEPSEPAPESATALVGEMKILIPLAGLIDKQAELTRLEKNLDKLRANLHKSETKLNNDAFVQRAPADVVDKERARVQDMRQSLKQLQEQADKIRAL